MIEYGLIVALLLGVASPAWATVTLHFTFGLTRQVDACWEEGDRLKYRVGGQSYEIAKAEVARIEGTCSSAAPATAGLAAPPATSPVAPVPTDAMLAAGRLTLPPSAWTPPVTGGCRTRGVDVALRRVIDGDTIEVRMPDGHTEVVRYVGMNTPEVHHPEKGEEPGGRAATALNETLVTGKRLELVFDVQTRDRYGRLLAYAYANGGHVNAALVERGYAAAATFPPNVCFAERFRSLERQARDARRGLWGEPGHEATLVAARDLNVLPEADDSLSHHLVEWRVRFLSRQEPQSRSRPGARLHQKGRDGRGTAHSQCAGDEERNAALRAAPSPGTLVLSVGSTPLQLAMTRPVSGPQ